MSAAMAPFAPPAAPPSAPIAKPVASGTTAPLAPFGLPVGFMPPAAVALADDDDLDDPFCPMAPLATTPRAGGTEREPEAAGPNESIQYNDFGRLAGSPRFTWNENNRAFFINGSLYFDSTSGGTVSSLNGLLNVAALSTINIVSNQGGVNMQVSGPNVISISSAAAGFVAIQGVLYRGTGVGVTYTNYPVTCQASMFRCQNSSGSVAFFTVNPNFGQGSPINMQSLPTAPTFLNAGDVWNNGGNLEIWGGLPETAGGGGSGSGRGESLFRFFGAIVSTAAAVMHWVGGLRIPRPGRIFPKSIVQKVKERWLD